MQSSLVMVTFLCGADCDFKLNSLTLFNHRSMGVVLYELCNLQHAFQGEVSEYCPHDKRLRYG